MERRTFIGHGLALAAGASLTASIARAQGANRIVVANWGGDWNDRTVRHVEAPLLESKGYTVVRDLNEQPQRQAKLIAERQLPRGTTDVNHFGESEAHFLSINDALETLDYARIPNSATLQPGMRRPYFLPWLYSSWEIVYNPAKVGDLTGSLMDLWNPKYKGKVGVMDQNYPSSMQAASLVSSGRMNDFDGAKRALLEWKKAVAPKVVPSHQQAAAALKAEDIWLVANYRARGLQWQKDGLNVRTMYPKEGGITTVFGAVIPRRAANKEGAYVYLNALIDPVAMRGLCAENFYTPSNTAVTMPNDLGTKIAYTESQRATLKHWDYGYWASNQAIWLDWWKKEFLG